ncbi:MULTISPECIES: DUF2177 family protein [Cellvibrio]|uniref:Membrane protein n=1 Tax=Cellvibrio fibrivorans TaxID=126350 RepID=A0ABU1UW83_9GAMM|nr:DUF2177 family protein [Cellvibrio fibrivorans]MDR7089392.1 putative membrane protein [Cellvibrio fibrivorans]
MPYIAAYLGAAVVFCVMDFVWLTLIAKSFYQSHMGELMAVEIRIVPAIIFYMLYLAGLVLFAISPALREQNWLMAVGLGLGLGVIAYGSYDLTNMATLKGWSLSLTLVDMAWGAFVSAISALAGFYAARIFAGY